MDMVSLDLLCNVKLSPLQDAEMVQNLLKMKETLDEIWSKAFQRNESFGHALKEAFEHFINQRANKPAELIAKFLDQELRAGNKGQTEEDLDANLDKALLLFRHISVSFGSAFNNKFPQHSGL